MADLIEIPVTPGMRALVDAKDAPSVAGFKWYASRKRHTTYAQRTRAAGEPPGPKTISMHRQILCPPSGVHVDHVNGDGLDNRRENLRPATPSQNGANNMNYPIGPSGYRGVRRAYTGRRKPGGWRAAAKVDGRTVHIGSFANPEDAARAYDAFVLAHHGQFAVLNFPPAIDQAQGIVPEAEQGVGK